MTKHLGPDFDRSHVTAKSLKFEYFEPDRGSKTVAKSVKLESERLVAIMDFLDNINFDTYTTGIDLHARSKEIDAVTEALRRRPGWEKFNRVPIVQSIWRRLRRQTGEAYWKQDEFTAWLENNPEAKLDVERE
ncbi:hypothetical protein LTR10_018002 [Elasticomyces elasticus]|uniref:NmrA-like domain-containing protein n=1 Tax=Exophiala sideris TaxID=1016849 RepID=A0ABR0JBU1_9EURO|nr:hypothetical protein LTR10_018002 [Elasticomyces elasticus]KAK5026099.1 hypothetical protein LTS07_007624 [Exophiala sideris]KAK5032353.1 hypothetical protein LTR13_007176 [Exophiala sideris]KAK5059509.1 hypothetical protein LTR69_006098 [Exophiala sideris]KAK5186671.1 hypothetical protein LTR44_000677 [Eurotiomycetes sp. CCFEE 6388]